MFGNNPKRPPMQGDGTMLDVQSIFPTLQGEGGYVGRRSVFVRLGGCNLACDFCDTEFESYQPLSMDAILAKVASYMPQRPTQRQLVVITGGEPLRQPIAALCDALLAAGYDVQIETNGTLHRTLDDRVRIVCSPKMGKMGYIQPHAALLPRIEALKFLVSVNREDYTHVPDWALQWMQMNQSPDACIFIQPMDEQDATKNAANQRYAVDLCMQHGYRLSMQLHKILNIE